MGSRDNTRLAERFNKFSEQINDLASTVLKKSDIEPVFDKIRDDVKDMLQSFHDEIYAAFNETLSKQSQEIETLNNKLAMADNKVSVLNDKLAVYGNTITNIKAEQNKAEQYSRRQSLRIYDVPMQRNETANDCLAIVKKLITDEELDIPESVIDRAHRIGRKGKKPPAIIVKCTTWRHRTLMYRHRETINKNHKWRVSLDLTRANISILEDVRRAVERDKVEEVTFVACDVNCQPFMCTTDKKLIRFSSVEEALNKIELLRFPKPQVSVQTVVDGSSRRRTSHITDGNDDSEHGEAIKNKTL